MVYILSLSCWSVSGKGKTPERLTSELVTVRKARCVLAACRVHTVAFGRLIHMDDIHIGSVGLRVVGGIQTQDQELCWSEPTAEEDGKCYIPVAWVVCAV